MDAIAEQVIGGLSSLALKELGIICNLEDDKQKIKSRVFAIKAVLKDAEAKAYNDQDISNWLEDLKDVLFDADDLLDDFSTEALRRKLMTRNKIIKRVQIFFSKRNQIAYAFKMGHKMKEIRERLADIGDTMHNLPLQLTDHPVEIPLVYRQSQTYSYVRENEIIGREQESKRLKGYLFDANMTDNVSVISIVGIGGLGKTALAQLVYNDKAVQAYFEPTMWVCVSDEFDICKIAQNIVENARNGVVEQVQQDLRNKIRGKKYLLVLDDVWNEDSELWLKLKCLLMEGGKGGKIIVTTRSSIVARIMSTHPPLILEGLDPRQSWELFCQVAFDEGKEPRNSELEDIGKDIVKKCGGVPLAIRTVGSLLFSRNLGQSDWQYFRDVEFSKIEQQQNKILSILKLSYDHLPSSLKNCFAYCSFFPKDYEFDKQFLIWLWVAEGFIQPSDDIRCEEDVGHEYFMYLLSISFFQVVEVDEYGEIESCMMHDLIHDLAQSVAGNEYVVLSEGKAANIEKRTRHLSHNFTSHPNNLLSSFPKGVKIRTFLPSAISYRVENIQGKSVFGFVLSLKCLRALILSNLDTEEIPKRIKELKHLRFLHLFKFGRLQKLPSEIASLHNLQTLLVIDCPLLKELPSNFNKLTCLRHLLCLRLGEVALEYMPRGLGELSSLQTLVPFVLGPTSSISSLTVLSGLINLRSLAISRLELLRDCAQEVEAATVLLDKGHLQQLLLSWSESNGSTEDEEVKYNDEMILQGLQPQNSIKSLSIFGFCGESLPDWMGNLSSLITLAIVGCKFLTSLPEGIHNLQSLQKLDILLCPLLEDRCKRETGEDWAKIAHIPNVRIYEDIWRGQAAEANTLYLISTSLSRLDGIWPLCPLHSAYPHNLKIHLYSCSFRAMFFLP